MPNGTWRVQDRAGEDVFFGLSRLMRSSA